MIFSITIISHTKITLKYFWIKTKHWSRNVLGNKQIIEHIFSSVLPFLRIYIYRYIAIHRKTVSLYHNSSIWLDMQDASSWDQNPADFTSVWYLTPKLSSFLPQTKGFFTHIFLHICYRLLECWIHEKSFAFKWISQPAIPHSSGQLNGETYIYIYI